MNSSVSYIGFETLENMNQAKFYNKWTLKKFEKYLKGSILEVGCGIGNFTATLSIYGDVTAIDIDQNLIKKFTNKNTDIKVGFGDIEKGDYFFPKKTFDTIVCINVLEHIENDEKALENIYKLLKKDGNLIILVPIYNFLYGEIDRSIGHFRRYEPDDLVRRIKNHGYKIISHKKLNFLGAIGWFISGKIMKNTKVTESKIKLFNLISPILILERIIEPPVGTSILIIAQKQ